MAFTVLLSFVLTLLVAFMAWRLNRAYRLFRAPAAVSEPDELPTVSVCIPARNETHAMAQCLERVLASDYEKMEIVVFDDSSADDTSVLIKSFAHAGVRFVPGSDLPEGWLGKNHALEVLAREASGEYIVFMDVDTQITPWTISQLARMAESEGLEMLSVIPGRGDGWRASVLFGHLRYFWELLFSTRRAPAAASSLWLIRRELLLERFEGFAMLKDDVSPEITLARLVAIPAYRCVLSDGTLGVTYEKKWASQLETGRRLLYPRVGGRWWAGIVATALLALLNLPLFGLLSGMFFGWGIPQMAALWFMLAFIALYASFTYRLRARGWWLGALLWPVVALQELCLLVLSFVGYARGNITWKGRSVTARPSNTDALIIGR